MKDAILLRAGETDLGAVALRGAELQFWRSNGADLIWTPDPTVWRQTAPLLFPVVGWTRDGRARVGEAVFPLGLHGFARSKSFAVAARTPDSATLVLEDDEETLALYPFAFRFEASFRLRPGELTVTLTTTNRDQRPLPYAVGLHPAFRWPLLGSQEAHAIRFAAEERAEVPVIAPGGLFSSRTRKIPLEMRELPLSPSLMADEALCFLNVASRRLVYDNGAGAALAVELDNFPHVALWALPPAPFLCIEAWTGHGDPEDFDGDLYEKPSMLVLAPGESASHGATFRLEKRTRVE